jgi:hypothetical protein
MRMVLLLSITKTNLINNSLFKGNKMAKQQYQSNPRVQQIFEDLEKYLEFCQDYGYKYNEADLYDQRSYVFRQFAKCMSGKPAKNQWVEHARP